MAKKEQEEKKADQEEVSDAPDEGQTADGNPYLETNIDKLYKLVNKRKSLSFIQVAEEFDVPKEQVVSWARILEDHKLAKVHYPVFGTPIIFAIEAEDKRIFGDDDDAPKEKPHKKGPKLMLVMIAAAAALFLGMIMVVNNPTTIGLRSQIMGLATRMLSPFGFLRYPLNIIIPIAIILAIAWAAFSVRHKKHAKRKDEARELAEEENVPDEDPPSGKEEKRKEDRRRQEPPSGKEGKEEPPKEPKAPRDERRAKKRPDEIQDRIERIRKKLGS